MIDWQPIESAPKNATEILAYRADAGVFICRWECMGDIAPEKDIQEGKLDPDFECWWHDAYGWLEDILTPTHWAALPEGPQGNEEPSE